VEVNFFIFYWVYIYIYTFNESDEFIYLFVVLILIYITFVTEFTKTDCIFEYIAKMEIIDIIFNEYR